MKFYDGAIETHLHVIEDTGNTHFWEISVAETILDVKGSPRRVVRFGFAINRETGLTLDWKSYAIESNAELVQHIRGLIDVQTTQF
jgi:hypothetical protein